MKDSKNFKVFKSISLDGSSSSNRLALDTRIRASSTLINSPPDNSLSFLLL